MKYPGSPRHLPPPPTSLMRGSRHGLLRKKENSFMQPDDAVDPLTNSFLFLLHKPHRSNKNHKKRKRPSPSLVTTFNSSHAPSSSHTDIVLCPYDRSRGDTGGGVFHVPLHFPSLQWPSSLSGAEAQPRALPGVPTQSSCPPVLTQPLCPAAGKATSILAQLHLFYTSHLAHCRESEE